MRYKKQKCDDCDLKTEHAVMGFMPFELFADKAPIVPDKEWVNPHVCTRCGSANLQETNQETVDFHINRLLNVYREHNVVDESDMEEF